MTILLNFIRYTFSCGQAKRGVCPDPQGEEEGKRGGQNGSRRGCQGSQYTPHDDVICGDVIIIIF